MIAVPAIDDLARRLAELVPAQIGDARRDLAANFKDALRASLRRLDLVTREEFDAQCHVLRHTRELVEALERRIAKLEIEPGAGAAH